MRKIVVDKQIAVEWVKSFVIKHCRLPGLNDWSITQGAPYNKTSLYKEIGGPNAVLEMAGYRQRSKGQSEDLDEVLLERLRTAIILSRTTDRDVLRQRGLHDRSVYEKRFGSWSKAITLSGIDNRHRALLRYFENYSGENPICFLKNHIGQNGNFTEKQETLIRKAQEIDGDPKLVRKSINYNVIKQLFGYVSVLLIAADFIPALNWKTGTKYVANDGHMCDSQQEVEIDNYLTKLGLIHRRQAHYPIGKMTCDFAIDNIFIEYAGLINAGYKSYVKTIAKKQEIATQHGIHLIVVVDTSQQSKLQLRAAIERELYGKTP